MYRKRSKRKTAAIVLLAAAIPMFAACGVEPGGSSATSPNGAASAGGAAATNMTAPSDSPTKTGTAPTPGSSGENPGPNNTGTTNDPARANAPAAGKSGAGTGNGAVKVVAKPEDIAVLVNKTYALPDNYKPNDLVEPNVPFIFKEKSEKRLLRKEAAAALEKLFAAAKKDGISLAGVSGFRSQATQKTLFDNYVKKDGEEAAMKYSARPGQSEHQTGLAIDVSGSDGKCAAQDCFADTKEAKWLAEHAAEHGFIIRYPKGKESVTGYQYEPWHLRYVGVKIAKEIAEKGLTLEEYVQNTVPVAN